MMETQGHLQQLKTSRKAASLLTFISVCVVAVWIFPNIVNNRFYVFMQFRIHERKFKSHALIHIET
jgi:hypothetical protein